MGTQDDNVLTRVAQQLAQSQQGAMSYFKDAWVAVEAPLRLLKQSVVPLDPVPCLPLLHQHKACLPRHAALIPHRPVRAATVDLKQ